MSELSPERVDEIMAALRDPSRSAPEVARALGMSKANLYDLRRRYPAISRALDDKKEARRAKNVSLTLPKHVVRRVRKLGRAETRRVIETLYQRAHGGEQG